MLCAVATPEIIAYLNHIKDLDKHVPVLLDGLCKDMAEGNRIGRLSGLDKNDNPLKACTYRGASKTIAKAARGGALYGVPTLKHYLGPELQLASHNNVLAASPGNGNLTSSEYKKLTGPPLAPRGSRSRTIINFFTQWIPDLYSWTVRGQWVNVLSKKGVPILEAHFKGLGHLPVRDLQGIRPSTMVGMRARVDDWTENLLQGP